MEILCRENKNKMAEKPSSDDASIDIAKALMAKRGAGNDRTSSFAVPAVVKRKKIPKNVAGAAGVPVPAPVVLPQPQQQLPRSVPMPAPAPSSKITASTTASDVQTVDFLEKQRMRDLRLHQSPQGSASPSYSSSSEASMMFPAAPMPASTAASAGPEIGDYIISKAGDCYARALAAYSAGKYYDAYCEAMSSLRLLDATPNTARGSSFGVPDITSVRMARDVVASILAELQKIVSDAVAKFTYGAVGGSGPSTRVYEQKEAAKRVWQQVGPEGHKSCKLWFENIVGQQTAKDAIVNGFVNPLLYPNVYGELASGIIFYGLPGTGKTMLARAAVNELQYRAMIPGKNGRPCLNVLLFTPNGADMKGKYVGDTEKNIVSIFHGASELASEWSMEHKVRTISLIFIDEIDGLTPPRGGSDSAITASAVNTVLQVMEGYGKRDNVVVMAATNFLTHIDSAVLRRFNYRIQVNTPTETEYAQLLNMEIGQFARRSMSATEYDRTLGLVDDTKGSGAADSARVELMKRPAGTPDFCPRTPSATRLWDWEQLYTGEMVRKYLDQTYIAKFAAIFASTDRAGPGGTKVGPYSPSDVSKVFQVAVKLMAQEAMSDGRFVRHVPPSGRDWGEGQGNNPRYVSIWSLYQPSLKDQFTPDTVNSMYRIVPLSTKTHASFKLPIAVISDHAVRNSYPKTEETVPCVNYQLSTSMIDPHVFRLDMHNPEFNCLYVATLPNPKNSKMMSSFVLAYEQIIDVTQGAYEEGTSHGTFERDVPSRRVITDDMMRTYMHLGNAQSSDPSSKEWFERIGAITADQKQERHPFYPDQALYMPGHTTKYSIYYITQMFDTADNWKWYNAFWYGRRDYASIKDANDQLAGFDDLSKKAKVHAICVSGHGASIWRMVDNVNGMIEIPKRSAVMEIGKDMKTYPLYRCHSAILDEMTKLNGIKLQPDGKNDIAEYDYTTQAELLKNTAASSASKGFVTGVEDLPVDNCQQMFERNASLYCYALTQDHISRAIKQTPPTIRDTDIKEMSEQASV